MEVYEKENAELKARVKELESKLGFVSDANAATAEKNGVVNGGVDINLLDTDADLLPMSPAPHQQQQVGYDSSHYPRYFICIQIELFSGFASFSRIYICCC